MPRQIPVASIGDLLPEYRGTPIEQVLRYQNPQEPMPATVEHPELLVVTCMDFRIRLRVPDHYAYMLRTAGASLRSHEFDVAFAIAVGGVSAIAIVGHTDCGMSRVTQVRDTFVNNLVRHGGWSQHDAVHYYHQHAGAHYIGDPAQSAWRDAARLRQRFPSMIIAPLLYRVEDHTLVQLAD